jgi:hypothetical protein
MSKNLSTLLVEGKKIPVSFSYSSLAELEEHFDQPATNLINHVAGSFRAQLDFMFIAFEHGIRISKSKIEVNKDELGDMITPKHFEQVCEIFINHFPQLPGDETETEPNKKK